MEIFGYIIAGLIFLVVLTCALTPLILDLMSKEEREEAGIVWKEDK